MGLNIFIALVFACTAAAGPVGDNLLGTNASIFRVVDTLASKFDNLYVLDDNDKPVKLDLHKRYTESEEATQKDLKNRVLFYLYTRQTKNNPELLHLNDVNELKHSHFDPKKETKFVTHGWVNSKKSKACTLVRDAFLQHADCNVIVIDWSSIAKRPYVWSSSRVLMVSQYVSKMIDFVVSQGLNPSRVTVVGHSLGGHVAGLSAHYASHKLNYVVALDPALPNFMTAGPGKRVSYTDANYVEIIHTNAGLLGYESSIGHADFFPNGGSKQIGCPADITGACSHSRSYHYYAESINTRIGFVAKKCNSYEKFVQRNCDSRNVQLMGGIAPKLGVKGDYYLETHPESPFAKGRS
ncbi:pancreatic triacylglycerol lipase-like [Xylocopa sonorina]|uniref:pancreatic triacylglycerol lipase-like n=1 Tax=Xylocopa sonorina TaxID=1818115 RepID=UPI00403AA56B